jgi:hypothetical protein
MIRWPVGRNGKKLGEALHDSEQEGVEQRIHLHSGGTLSDLAGADKAHVNRREALGALAGAALAAAAPARSAALERAIPSSGERLPPSGWDLDHLRRGAGQRAPCAR